MDNLKKYLQQHLNELDEDVPGEAVWQKIQQSQAPVLPKRNVVKMVWRYAAAACILAAIATGIFYINKKDFSTIEVAAIDAPEQTETLVLKQPADATDTDVEITASEHTQQPQTTVPAQARPATNDYVKHKLPKQPKFEKRTITIDPGQLLVQDVERNYNQLVNYQLQRLRTTPVYAESPNYFSTFKQQLKQIETDESTIKKDIKLHGLTDELLQQLININQQKLTVLKDLQAEINKLNNKVKSPVSRADSTQAFFLTM